MSLSTVLYLFLAHLGVGIVFTLALVGRDAGVKFFRFNAGLAAILLVIALAFRYGAPAPADLDPSRTASYGLLALNVATAAVVMILGRQPTAQVSPRPSDTVAATQEAPGFWIVDDERTGRDVVVGPSVSYTTSQ